MKRLSLPVVLIVVLTQAATSSARQELDTRREHVESALTTSASVEVSLCIASGYVVVRGWNRPEVRAVSPDRQPVELRGERGADSSSVAHIEVVARDGVESVEGESGGCDAFSNVVLNVPRGARVRLKTRSGRVVVDGVAEAHIDTSSGDIDVRRVSRLVEATSLSGDVSLEEVAGDVQLNCSSGSIKAVDVRASTSRDGFSAKSVSGNVALERVAFPKVEVTVVRGAVRMSGPLAPGSLYDLKSTLGDVTLLLPSDVSFRVQASVSPDGTIITNFPVGGGQSGRRRTFARSLQGQYGRGSATLLLSSFSGSVQLLRASVN